MLDLYEPKQYKSKNYLRLFMLKKSGIEFLVLLNIDLKLSCRDKKLMSILVS